MQLNDCCLKFRIYIICTTKETPCDINHELGSIAMSDKFTIYCIKTVHSRCTLRGIEGQSLQVLRHKHTFKPWCEACLDSIMLLKT